MNTRYVTTRTAWAAPALASLQRRGAVTSVKRGLHSGMGGYSSFFVRGGGNKDFLVILRENKGILKAREQNFHKKTTVLDQFLSLLCQYFLKVTHF